VSDDSLQIFADEAEDLLGLAEQALLNLDDLNNQSDTLDGINDLFRTFHTIKGAAGLFGLDTIVDFTHIVESVLVKVREGGLKVDEEMVSLFLSSRDHLEKLVEQALNGEGDLAPDLKEAGDNLLQQLGLYLGGSSNLDGSSDSEGSQLSNPKNANNSVSGSSEPDNKSLGVINENWHISLRFGLNTLRNGMDPMSFINYLNKIGEVKSVALLGDAIPPWSEFDPESCFLGFEVNLSAPNTNKEILEEVFEFVQEDCKIYILPPHSHIDTYIKLINELPESDMRIGDILLACGALTLAEKDGILTAQDKISDEMMSSGAEQKIPKIGEIAVDNQVVQQEVVDAAVQKQNAQKQQRDSSQQTIRVNALKLENLVNLVGELVIGSANSELNARRIGDVDLNEAMENLLHLVEEVRDTALGLRMVQIGETFNRYKRVVREVSRETGKDIDLVIRGAETELDKTLIEKIGDPLMHLVRNAVDHGIETPEKRSEAGKPAKGVVSLDAFHDSGNVMIQIKDDGGGLSKERIINKALEKGLISEGQQLTDQETFRLIFEAGFSTAETVSNISGRGVGMDVVRKNIEALRGHVEMESKEGVGTTITIRLPLTLAIIDGFQVRVGDAQYIVPLNMVEECIELNDALRGEDEDANYVNLRGEILPFMHLGDIFNPKKDGGDSVGQEEEVIETAVTGRKHSDNIVVVHVAGKKAGFVVDELLGEHQTVIKPLGKVFQNLKGISGTTILGSGEVAMIIDIPEMVDRVINSGKEQFVSKSVH